MADLKLNSGLIRYDIKDEDGTPYAYITFNPADMSIATRGKEAVDRINKLIEEYKSRDTEDIIEEMELIAECESKVQSIVLYMLGPGAKTDVFDVISPFALLDNGKFFVEEFLETITPEITKTLEARTASRRAELDKKYRG